MTKPQYETTRQTARKQALKYLKDGITQDTVMGTLIKNYEFTYNQAWAVVKEAKLILGVEQ